MATINYKCDTCKRETELLENRAGLTVFGRCTITKNCKGFFYQLKRNRNNRRESIPRYDRELDDYSKRKFFVPFIQAHPSRTWTINHGFGLSCVYIVYNATGDILPDSMYTVTNIAGTTSINFDDAINGTVHILSRTGGIDEVTARKAPETAVQVSYSDTLTFAVPKYITRLQSGSAPVLPPISSFLSPTPSPSPLVNTPLDMTSLTIRIEIEVTKPNEPTVVCVETLEANISSASAWMNWPQILVRNRKHYITKTLTISKLKVFANTNNQKLTIPLGTRFKITRIDYGTGLLVNIPDRGLLVLLADKPYIAANKNLTQLFDCGEMVNSFDSEFFFDDLELFVSGDAIESTYPKISKYL